MSEQQGLWTICVPGGPALMDNVIAALDLAASGRGAGPIREVCYRMIRACGEAVYEEGVVSATGGKR